MYWGELRHLANVSLRIKTQGGISEIEEMVIDFGEDKIWENQLCEINNAREHRSVKSGGWGVIRRSATCGIL